MVEITGEGSEEVPVEENYEDEDFEVSFCASSVQYRIVGKTRRRKFRDFALKQAFHNVIQHYIINQLSPIYEGDNNHLRTYVCVHLRYVSTYVVYLGLRMYVRA